MPLDQKDARELIARRSPEWREHHLRWSWLLDSLEGGDRYRQAVYGTDFRGLPIRNLIRHKREAPDPRRGILENSATYLAGMATGIAGGYGGPVVGADPAQFADDDDYEMRRARTPVPTFVPEVIDTYCSKIFASEIDRETPTDAAYDRLRGWWADVDGLGTSVDDWMGLTVGRLLLAFGQLDLCFDHPAPAPDQQPIATEAHAIASGIKRCVAAIVLPQNMLWWKLDDRGHYVECLVQECRDDDDGGDCFRHWTAAGSVAYDADGKVLAEVEHPYRRVPIARVFDRRKPRCRNVGQSRVEAVAERQREYYNRDSELILSDSTQAHPLLQGPEDYLQEGGEIPVGPGFLLPMKRNGSGGDASYQGFEVVDFPKGSSESLRLNKADIREDVDRDGKLTKPAGSAGTARGTVGQSGVSKQIDHDGLHSVLSQVARAFAKAETKMVELALAVLFDGDPPKAWADVVKVSYPTVFSLYAADELAAIAADLQGLLAQAGEAPGVEGAILCEIVRKSLPGRDDATYAEYDAEIEAALARKAKGLDQMAEGVAPGALSTKGAAGGGTNAPVVSAADVEEEDTPEVPDNE